MVTLIKYGALSGGEKYNVNVLSLDGLSTDTKPIRIFIEYGSDGREVGRTGIPNGSLYTEIDTGDTYMYDADGTTWYKVSLGGGGGGGGTTDYSALTNKPSINNTTLSGNKTSADLGLQSALTSTQLSAVNSGINSTKVGQIETNRGNIATEQAKTTGMGAGGSNYITVGGIRLYVSDTAPTGTIPDGSVGVGW